MCQHEQCRTYLSYLLTMLALIGSIVYSSYSLIKNRALLLDHDCKELPWANLSVTGSSGILAISILIILCWESMGCKRQLTMSSIIAYLSTNIWAFSIFWIMGDDCQKYYQQNYPTFWYMNLAQYIVFGLILIIMIFNILLRCIPKCNKNNVVYMSNY